MKKYNKTAITRQLLLSAAIAITGAANAAAVNIANSSFESGWDNWIDNDPSAISGDAYTGSKSAKITGSGGRVGQDVTLTANTDYELTAFVKGSGQVGINLGTSTRYKNSSSSDWTEVKVSFNSGSSTSAQIFGKYYSSDGRFDDFKLESIDSDQPSDPTGITATASSNDGNLPENVLDNDITTRWSANGNGQWLQLDLGQTQEVAAVGLAFYRGDQRTSTFDIEVSTDGNSWQPTLSSQTSAGNSLNAQTFQFSDEVNVRYIRYVGYGNSSNTWNSLTVFNVLDCADVDCSMDPQEPPVDSGDFDWSGWKVTLPVNGDTWYNDGNTSSAAEIQPSACTDDIFDEELNTQYFWSDSEGLHFKVPMNLDGKTPNTSYIRSELRELHDWTPCGTTSLANWAYGGNHTLEATLRIDDFNADSTKVVVGQIHGHDISYATIKLHWEGDSKPIRVIYNQTPDSSSSASVNLGYVDSSGFWSYTIKMTNTGIELSSGGVTKTLTFGNELNNKWKDETFYFKAGLYPQETPNPSSSDTYEATFSKVKVSHN